MNSPVRQSSGRKTDLCSTPFDEVGARCFPLTGYLAEVVGETERPRPLNSSDKSARDCFNGTASVFAFLTNSLIADKPPLVRSVERNFCTSSRSDRNGPKAVCASS